MHFKSVFLSVLKEGVQNRPLVRPYEQLSGHEISPRTIQLPLENHSQDPIL